MGARRKRLRIGPAFLPVISQMKVIRDYNIEGDGLPAGTKIIDALMLVDADMIELVIENERFDEVADGEPYPEVISEYWAIARERVSPVEPLQLR